MLRCSEVEQMTFLLPLPASVQATCEHYSGRLLHLHNQAAILTFESIGQLVTSTLTSLRAAGVSVL